MFRTKDGALGKLSLFIFVIFENISVTTVGLEPSECYNYRHGPTYSVDLFWQTFFFFGRGTGWLDLSPDTFHTLNKYSPYSPSPVELQPSPVFGHC